MKVQFPSFEELRQVYCIYNFVFAQLLLNRPQRSKHTTFVMILLPYNHFTTPLHEPSSGLPSLTLPNSLTRLGLPRAKVTHLVDRIVTRILEVEIEPSTIHLAIATGQLV